MYYVNNTIVFHYLYLNLASMPNTFHLFSPFTLYNGSNRFYHSKTQEVVWYAESRFRHVLNRISKANKKRQVWMQNYLREELVCPILFHHIQH